MILMAVDLGERRVGFAVSDPDERLALPSGFAPVRSLGAAVEATAAKARQEGAGLLVVGNPINMNGRPGPKSREAQQFADMLVEEGFTVLLWDERLTTSEATRMLKAAGLKRKQRQQLIDANSAQRLLESFMDNRRRNMPPPQ